MGNAFKTALLLTALTVLLMGLGRVFGGENGMLLALGIAAVTNFIAYFFSDKIALATYRAQPVTREQLPRAYNIVERLTQKIGLPMPGFISSQPILPMLLPLDVILNTRRWLLPKVCSICSVTTNLKAC